MISKQFKKYILMSAKKKYFEKSYCVPNAFNQKIFIFKKDSKK